MSIRVILADDHAMLRHGLSKALQQEKDIDVIGQANNGYMVLELVKELSPDIVVMDIGMPELNGMEATRKISKDHPKVKVIALSMYSSRKYVKEMFKAGASGYLLKDCPLDELIKAVKIVTDGKTYISPSIGDTVIQDYLAKPEEGDSAFSMLTAREREVLQLLAEGKTTKQAGQKLGISPKTIEVHRLRIMEKLNIDNIAQLTKYAIQEGLTTLNP